MNKGVYLGLVLEAQTEFLDHIIYIILIQMGINLSFLKAWSPKIIDLWSRPQIITWLRTGCYHSPPIKLDFVLDITPYYPPGNQTIHIISFKLRFDEKLTHTHSDLPMLPSKPNHSSTHTPWWRMNYWSTNLYNTEKPALHCYTFETPKTLVDLLICRTIMKHNQ